MPNGAIEPFLVQEKGARLAHNYRRNRFKGREASHTSIWERATPICQKEMLFFTSLLRKANRTLKMSLSPGNLTGHIPMWHFTIKFDTWQLPGFLTLTGVIYNGMWPFNPMQWHLHYNVTFTKLSPCHHDMWLVPPSFDNNHMIPILLN
jgi:hypothetical protein